MRAPFLAILILGGTLPGAFTGSTAIAAAAANCRPNMPTVTLSVKLSPIKLIRRHSTAEIRALARNLGDIAHSNTLNGLYRGIIKLDARIHAQRSRSNGRTCTYVTGVELTETINRTIYIASEYPISSCWYNAIRAHEMQHVRFDEEVVRASRSRLKATMINAIRPHLTHPQGPLQTAINAATRSILDRMNKERRAKHARIDTLENYQRNSRRCQPAKM